MKTTKFKLINFFNKLILLIVLFIFFSVFNLNAQNNTTIGIGTSSNSTTTYPAPFGNYNWGAKHQFLILASELINAGIPANAFINSIGFNITNVNNSNLILTNYNLKVFSANYNNPLASSFVSPNGFVTLNDVSATQNIILSNGWNSINLTSGFYWDGVTNLIIETCFNNTTNTQNVSTEWTSNLSGNVFTRFYISNTSTNCSSTSTTATSSSTRPIIRIGWGMPIPVITPFNSNGIICSGTSLSLQANNSFGQVYWYANNCGGSPIDSGVFINVTPNTTTTYYARNFYNGQFSSCSSLLVTVKSTSNAGNISANQFVCIGNLPSDMRVYGYTGDNFQWQKSSDNINWSNISGATNDTLFAAQAGVINNITYYRALVSNAPCSLDSTASLIVTPKQLPTVNAGFNQQVCLGNSTTLFGSGSATSYVWTSNGIPIGTNSSVVVTPTVLSSNSYILTGTGANSCINKDTVVVIADSLSNAGLLGPNQTICQNTTPAPLILNGYAGTITWQKSFDNITWVDILTGPSILPSVSMGTLNNLNYFRCIVTNNACASDTSNIVFISFVQASDAGVPVGGGVVCSGIAPISPIVLVNFVGNIQWQKSTNQTTWNSIIGATDDSLSIAQIGVLTVTTYYRAIVTNNPCQSDTSIVRSFAVISGYTAGTISPSLTQGCQIVNTGTLTNSSWNSPSITWEQSFDNINWSTVPNSTNLTGLNSTNLGLPTSVNKYFRVNATGCQVPLYSNVASIIVSSPPQIGTVYPFTQSICSGTATQLILSSFLGTIQWQSSTNGSTWSAINNATNDTLLISGLTNTTYYRALVTSGSCGSLTSNVDTVIVFTAPQSGTASSNQTICSGSTPTQLTLTGSTGIIQWQTSNDNVNWSSISGANATILTAAQMGGSLTSTKYYRAQLSNTNCSNIFSNVITITVNSVVPGIASIDQTICSGTAPDSLFLTNYIGNIQWQYLANGSTWLNLSGANNDTLPSALMLNIMSSFNQVFFRAVVSNSPCASAISNYITITFTPANESGVISSNQTICLSALPTPLTSNLTSGTLQWQSSPNSINWNNISGANAATLTAAQMGGALTSTKYFRLIASGLPCLSDTSNVITISVNQPNNAGTISSNQTICSGSIPSQLTLIGYSGTIQWQSSNNNTTWSIISGATSPTLTPTQMGGALAATKYFRVITIGLPCSNDTSNTVTITVSPTSVAGTASSSQTICFGATPTQLTLTGYNGTIQWQSSIDNTNWTLITGATTSVLSALQMGGALTATKYFRAVVTSGSCPSVISNTNTININNVNSGTASSNQTICSGSTPSQLTLTGYTGTIQWQSSINNSIWSNITGATSATLTATQMGGALTATKYFRAVVTTGTCSGISNTITITVVSAAVAGTASSNQTICTNTTPNNIILTGFNGIIQWQYSINGNSWFIIPGATDDTLFSNQMGQLTSPKLYRASVTNTPCSNAFVSNIITVTIGPSPVAGAASSNQTICTGTSPAQLTLTGYTGTIQWQSSLNNSTWTNINGATAATLSSTQMGGTLNSSKYFRAVITNSNCSVISNTITINVISNPIAGTAIGNQTICSGSTPSNLILTGYSGTTQWQVSANNSTWGNITTANNDTLFSVAMGSLTDTNYYRAVITNPPCTSILYSNTIIVNVSPQSNAGITSSNQSICIGSIPSAISLSGYTGSIQWQSSTNNINWSTINGATSSMLSSSGMGGALLATKYFRAIVTNSPCPSVTSNTVTITIDSLPIAGTASSNQSTCSGSLANDITLTGYRGTIQWQSKTGSIWGNINGATSATLTSAQMGGPILMNKFYRAIVSNGNCTKDTSNIVTITVLPAPTINAGVNQGVCIGNSVVLNATQTGGNQILWNNNVQNNLSFVPSTTTNYVATVLGTNGCNAQDTVTVIVNYPDSTTLYISALNSYFYNGNQFIQSGVYIDSLTNQYGCDSIVTINLNIVTGLNHEDLAKMIKVFPIPSSGIFNLECDLCNYENIEYTIADINGRIVRNSSNEIKRIDLTNEPSGVYFLNLWLSETSVKIKLVKM